MAGLIRKLQMSRYRSVRVPGDASSKGISPEDRMLLCFLAGIAGGTIMVNLLSVSLQTQAGYYVSLLDQNVDLAVREQTELFIRILKQRTGQLLLAWLVGLTAYGIWFFYVLSLGMGVGMGVIIALLTSQKGLMGLPLYLVSMCPHALIYVPVWCVMIVWGSRRSGRMRIWSLLLLVLLTAAGSACETWLNPYFMRIYG